MIKRERIMPRKEIQTHLVKKIAKSRKVCTNCNNEVSIGEAYHLEQGVDEHLHSLLARSFCSKCYAKYGERYLLRGKNS
jgi:hypothetical protein